MGYHEDCCLEECINLENEICFSVVLAVGDRSERDGRNCREAREAQREAQREAPIILQC